MAKNWTIDDFEMGRPLGKGKFGQVWLARDKNRGYIVALKIIKKSEVRSSENTRQLRREIEIHSNLQSENIIRMYGYFYDMYNVYLVLEYAGNGEFFKMLTISKRFSESTAANYILQVSNALLHMHRLNVIHRDIKPENMLLGSDSKVKIADLGWAVRNIDKKRYTYCGTLEYLAPEMYTKFNHDKSLDMWCLGVLCYEFLVGNPPFESKMRSPRETYEKVKNLSYTVPDYVSEEAKNFIACLLVVNSEKRMRAEMVPKHAWIIKHCGRRDLT
jgi:aurora kinase